MKVVVTSATRNAGMAVIRALGKNGMDVIGTDDRTLPFGLTSRYASRHYVYPPTEADGFVAALLSIIQKEKPEVLLALGGANLISKHKMEFEKHCHLLAPEFGSFSVAFDNQKTLEECAALGIPCPRILTEAEAMETLKGNSQRSAPLMLVIKPRKEVGGGQGVHFCVDGTSMKRAKTQIEDQFGETVIQEFIPGDTECMRTVNLIFDKHSRLAAYFTTRKIRQWPPTGGTSALSISTDERELVDTALPFFEKWQWQGPAEVEYKIDPRDHRPKLIEINPRFWGYIGFPIQCGVNFPLIACHLAKGGDAADWAYPKYAIGTKYINPTAYAKAVHVDFRRTKHKIRFIRQEWAELKGKKATNNLLWSDALSVIGKVLAELRPSNRSSYWFVTEKDSK
jgi:predicted ATP-grasp superfamily ATP-dependent carboligase